MQIWILNVYFWRERWLNILDVHYEDALFLEEYLKSKEGKQVPFFANFSLNTILMKYNLNFCTKLNKKKYFWMKKVWQYEVTTLDKWNGQTSKELANIIQITIRVLSVHNKSLDSLWRWTFRDFRTNFLRNFIIPPPVPFSKFSRQNLKFKFWIWPRPVNTPYSGPWTAPLPISPVALIRFSDNWNIRRVAVKL